MCLQADSLDTANIVLGWQGLANTLLVACQRETVSELHARIRTD